MKKILYIIIATVLFFTTAHTFANQQTIYTKDQLLNELKNEIKKGNRNIKITYTTNENITNEFGKNILLEALDYFEYEGNNFSTISFGNRKNNSENTMSWTIKYRTTEYEDKIVNDYAKQQAALIKSKTSNQAEMVYLVNELVKSKNTYSFNGISYGTAYGAVIDGKVVCHGYTLLTERLLSALGIENKIMIGLDNKSVTHSWNLVKLNNNWYHLDVTYNDTDKLFSNAYLLKSDSFISKTRTWDYYGSPKAVANYENIPLYVSNSNKIIKTEKPFENISKFVPEVVSPEVKPIQKEEVKVETKKEEVKIVETIKQEVSYNYDFLSESFKNNQSSIITREQFIESIMLIYESVNSDEVFITKYFSDTTNIKILKAYALGITSGTSENYFSPNNVIKREDAAVMIYRLLNLLNKTYYTSNETILDIQSFSSYAKEPVKFINSVGIMNGYNNYLNPKGELTKTDALELLMKTNIYAK